MAGRNGVAIYEVQRILKAMILSWKRVECPLRVKEDVLPQVDESKYLEVSFTNEGEMEREIDMWIGAASAVNPSTGVKEELSQTAELSINLSSYVPTIIYGDKLWVMTERTRLHIQMAKISFLHRVSGFSLSDRVMGIWSGCLLAFQAHCAWRRRRE